MEIQSCIRWQSEVCSIELRNYMAKFFFIFFYFIPQSGASCPRTFSTFVCRSELVSATFDHLICRGGKKKVTRIQQIQCWTYLKGGELLKYFGWVVRSKDCRIKNGEEMSGDCN